MSEFIKNVDHAKVMELKNIVGYEKGKIASLTLASNDNVGITLFAFDEGEGVSTHAAPGDAMVVVLDGEAQITIDGNAVIAKEGETVVMPAHIPHAVKAVTPFKMMLTVVK
ncbi:MAG TPA: cupin domain-containing protein [Candidatus Dorea intestinavium]|nr:cupin domain-containing protein [Candidatus Dorea intestinavium]